MAAMAGRKVRVQIATTDVAAARTDGITLGTETIDITTKDEAGIVTLLDDIGTKSVEMSCEGVLVGTDLLDIATANGEGSTLNAYTFVIDGLGDFAGQFAITSFEVSGAEGTDPATFTASFASSGAIAWTATP